VRRTLRGFLGASPSSAAVEGPEAAGSAEASEFEGPASVISWIASAEADAVRREYGLRPGSMPVALISLRRVQS
jgi:hypothetical protein